MVYESRAVIRAEQSQEQSAAGRVWERQLEQIRDRDRPVLGRRRARRKRPRDRVDHGVAAGDDRHLLACARAAVLALVGARGEAGGQSELAPALTPYQPDARAHLAMTLDAVDAVEPRAAERVGPPDHR